MITQKQKYEWVAALRSGEWKQCRGRLSRTNKGVKSHCCLHVAADLFGIQLRGGSHSGGHIPYYFLPKEVQKELVILNDHQRKSFPEIADYIEQNINARSEKPNT